ncbi:Gx transporter family protein [Aquisalimonas asiatica]|uniref:Heptaprenyl diphosphate synthase n=1 Tax=Aquisalimonas asiatica TaxID=406100 RepID=A0A1H8TQ59_9GAMM|nr:Gx transporter family protein [Aquisalimonas asiatica]SEO92956.1 heptaprenyl diphosphate synthase [Aquisalimonas asiatica]
MYRHITPDRDDLRIAALAALAVAIHVAETVVPSPIPGIRPGLANIVVVTVLVLFGWRAAAWVAILRVFAGGLLVGTFLSPTFVLSLAGAVSAIAALGLARWLPGIGPVGLSLLASMAHMSGQFLLAWLWLVPHPALPALLPVLMTAAVAFGCLNGMIAASLLRRLNRDTRDPRRSMHE